MCRLDANSQDRLTSGLLKLGQEAGVGGSNLIQQDVNKGMHNANGFPHLLSMTTLSVLFTVLYHVTCTGPCLVL